VFLHLKEKKLKKRNLRIWSLLLSVFLIIASYSENPSDILQLGGGVGNALAPAPAPLSQMEYGRPDMAEHDAVLEESCRIAREEKDIDKVLESVLDYYDVYDRFYTDLALADIYYSCDLTDIYWQKEYEYCIEQVATAEAGLEALYSALAESPLREELEADYFGEGYFDIYEGESTYNEALMALMEQEAQLESQYQQLLTGDIYAPEFLDENWEPMAQLLVELVQVRQQIAEETGYDSFPECAYEFYHARDYSAPEAEEYLVEVSENLTELYRLVCSSSVWDLGYSYCPESDTYRYVQQAAKEMGGEIARGFRMLDEESLCHIDYSPNKATGAYEVYLWSYTSPFIFLSPYLDQTDKLTFSHEFGHFLNDYVCGGSYAGTDIAEVHSQAFEYLCLVYGEDTQELEKYKLADSLCTYVEQAAYAMFEQRLYALEEEELTPEGLQELYEEVSMTFGFDSRNWDSREFVLINHFFTDPMYVISYVVSNDVAFQIYQMEKESRGAGLEVYEACLESQDSYLLWFAENYGLESPFAPGRLEQVRATLEEGLADYL
jgi:oligoendopeptidase F